MSDRSVTIFGGAGFIGRYLVQRLARRGDRVRVAVRNPDRALFLKPMGEVGQVVPVQANIRDDRSVAAAVAGADAVRQVEPVQVYGGAGAWQRAQGGSARRPAAGGEGWCPGEDSNFHGLAATGT